MAITTLSHREGYASTRLPLISSAVGRAAISTLSWRSAVIVASLDERASSVVGVTTSTWLLALYQGADDVAKKKQCGSGSGY